MTKLANKLVYIVQMIRLLHWTIEKIDNDYIKRILGRFLFTYLDSFTKLAPRLKNKIKKVGINVTDVQNRIKKLTKDYENDFSIIRDKLSAHRQVLSLSDTIACWNDIGYISVGYFVDECVEIYKELKTLNPTLPNYSDCSDYKNVDLENSLKKHPIENTTINVSSDVLALTRKNTVSFIPNGRFQHKGSQVASIVDILKIEYAILNSTNPTNKNFDRILKSLIIVDAISLVDNLYPHPDADSAYTEKSFLELGQDVALKGINILEESHNTIDTALVERVRLVRNKISAHIDPDTDINDLLLQLDNLNFMDIDTITVNQALIFYKCCDQDIRSQLFLMNRVELKNVIAIEDTKTTKKYNE